MDDEQNSPTPSSGKEHPYAVNHLTLIASILVIIALFLENVILVLAAAVIYCTGIIQVRLIDIRLAIEQRPNPYELPNQHPKQYGIFHLED